MEDRIEEDEKVMEDDKGILCRFDTETGGWEPVEDHCVKCGRKDCNCLNSFSAVAILESAEAGGGEEVKYVLLLCCEIEISFVCQTCLLVLFCFL